MSNKTKVYKTRILSVFIWLVCLLATAGTPILGENSSAERLNGRNSHTLQAPNARLTPPLSLAGGSRITLVSPLQWAPLASRLSKQLKDTHERYTILFGKIPAVQTTLKLMDSEEFYRMTGAPRWTNAMYYNGEITIPLSLNERIDYVNLERSIKHEYTHSVIHALSGGRCPGWLDEGLAQWAEGSVNPALEPALKSWLKINRPIPFDLLQGGFTRLESAMVPTAYAESLFATKTIINSFGFNGISAYFRHLRSGDTKDLAFLKAFKLTRRGFEKALGRSMSAWSKRPSSHLALN